MRLAKRAAEAESAAVLGLLYWIVVVPCGLLGRLVRPARQEPAWRTRPARSSVPLDEARRQS